MEGLQGARVPEDTRPACAGTQLGQPVPGDAACHTDTQVLPGGGESCEKGGWASRPLPVHKDGPILVDDAEVQGVGMQGDAAVTLVLLRIASPEVSSSLLRESLPLSAYHGGMLGRGPQ